MIDSLRFSQARQENVPYLRHEPRYNISKLEHESVPDNETMLASGSLMGFSLASKKWGMFRIEYAEEVTYNENAFERLILPKLQKTMIRALVSAHDKGNAGFDDIIIGKGRGMTVLLHGAPGLGKTLTAGRLTQIRSLEICTN